MITGVLIKAVNLSNGRNGLTEKVY